ncbi:hypothetical protein WR25_16314 [Diploscapter pachys]|uniref:Transcription initiation factor IIA subunit 2 n=1 Tax=Diploscapter pachys TaxID=2018661 RepID=A0A2A2JCK9_9BILA|nr:hypothetical protein WR25_16314 [Diploscapter pachys]
MSSKRSKHAKSETTSNKLSAVERKEAGTSKAAAAPAEPTPTPSSAQSPQVYRETTLGIALNSVIDDFVSSGQISPVLASRILAIFDRNMSHALHYRCSNKLHFHAKEMLAYRYCDSVWTIILKDVEFRDISRSLQGIIPK